MYESHKTKEEAEAEALRLAALKVEIQWSVQEAEATCSSEEATRTDCAIAWEQVSELREAVARSAPPPPSTSALPNSKKDAKAAAPARGLRDPLAGLTPSQVIGTVRDAPPAGSLQAAGKLERMLTGVPQPGAPKADADAHPVAQMDAVAADSILDAIEAAKKTCTEEPDACAAAWDSVEEMSQHKSRKKT